MLSELWDKITHPFPNFSGTTVEVWELIINFIPPLYNGCNYWSMMWFKLKHVSNRGSRCKWPSGESFLLWLVHCCDQWVYLSVIDRWVMAKWLARCGWRKVSLRFCDRSNSWSNSFVICIDTVDSSQSHVLLYPPYNIILRDQSADLNMCYDNSAVVRPPKRSCVQISTGQTYFVWEKFWFIPMNKSNLSHSAPVLYPTTHHSEQKYAHFCSEWCILVYRTGAFWYLWEWSNEIFKPFRACCQQN